jgi:FtsP/CotA-like multicopper oxidase with cupredoxin domain
MQADSVSSQENAMHQCFSHGKAIVIATLLATACASADTALISAAKDNTLYQPASGSTTNSNGAGEHLFVGRTDDGYIRRAAIVFALTNSIPTGSTITGATLTLYMSRTRDTANDATLHRALRSWGEGTSNATQEEGRGAQAAAGDVTWYQRFCPTSLWTTAGGDFRSQTSAVTSVNREGYYSWSSTGLVADVQMWFTNAGTNFGWIIKGDETTTKTAKRFDSRENATSAQRPVLRVDFISPAQVGACCLPDASCATLTSNQCLTAGGTFHGVGSTCATNPCPPPTGACCLPDGGCATVTSNQCALLNGVYRGDNVPCSSNLCPVVLAPFVDALPIPAALQPVSGTSGGAAYYEIPMRQVQQKLHRDLPLTTVWAYGSAFPGPVIEASAGLPVTVKWINDLRGTNGQWRTNHFLLVDTCLHGPDMAGAAPRTVVHLHGGKVAQKDDGYPEETFLPGESRTNFYANIQPPATIWFHDHALGITRLNVYMGLAGLYLVRDPIESALGLPSGANEVSLVIQDRTFRADGSLVYPAAWEEHFFGDTIVVNGKVWPYLIVRQGKYRFRVVNGSTSRTYRLALSSGANFQQIGTDGGMLAAPVPLTPLTLMPGERADLVIDFAPYASGTQILMTNSAPTPFPGTPGAGVIPHIMKFIVTNIAGHTAALPNTLRPFEHLSESNAVKHREFTLKKGSDPCTGSKWLINDLSWDDITEFPILGTTEVWSFINRSGVSHPMHLHLVLMQVLDRQPFIFTNNMVLTNGPRLAAAANEDGWKDTVACPPNEITRVIMRFDGYTGRYPYHCHIIEHEDHEMMRQFEVVAAPRFTAIRRHDTNIVLWFTGVSNFSYTLQHRDEANTGAWTVLMTNLLGTGGELAVTNSGGAGMSKKFYRIGTTP